MPLDQRDLVVAREHSACAISGAPRRRRHGRHNDATHEILTQIAQYLNPGAAIGMAAALGEEVRQLWQGFGDHTAGSNKSSVQW